MYRCIYTKNQTLKGTPSQVYEILTENIAANGNNEDQYQLHMQKLLDFQGRFKYELDKDTREYRLLKRVFMQRIPNLIPNEGPAESLIYQIQVFIQVAKQSYPDQLQAQRELLTSRLAEIKPLFLQAIVNPQALQEPIDLSPRFLETHAELHRIFAIQEREKITRPNSKNPFDTIREERSFIDVFQQRVEAFADEDDMNCRLHEIKAKYQNIQAQIMTLDPSLQLQYQGSDRLANLIKQRVHDFIEAQQTFANPAIATPHIFALFEDIEADFPNGAFKMLTEEATVVDFLKNQLEEKLEEELEAITQESIVERAREIDNAFARIHERIDISDMQTMFQDRLKRILNGYWKLTGKNPGLLEQTLHWKGGANYFYQQVGNIQEMLQHIRALPMLALPLDFGTQDICNQVKKQLQEASLKAVIVSRNTLTIEGLQRHLETAAKNHFTPFQQAISPTMQEQAKGAPTPANVPAYIFSVSLDDTLPIIRSGVRNAKSMCDLVQTTKKISEALASMSQTLQPFFRLDPLLQQAEKLKPAIEARLGVFANELDLDQSPLYLSILFTKAQI